MRRILLSLLGLVAGYVAGVILGIALVAVASPNMHDKSVEMAMTAAFVTGPMGGILGLGATLLLARRKMA